MWWYNVGIHLYTGGIKLASHFNEKAALWVRGRRDLFGQLRGRVSGERIIWIHAASLGEFEQGRPVMEAIKEQYPQYRILLTFFSPSGYETRRDYKGADWVFYLPADTPRNVRRFLDAVKPEAAIFIKYEFWINYLSELSKRGIPTYIISAVFRRDSVFFRPYGKTFRRALGAFSRIFVQDEDSRKLLAGIGMRNVSVSGDTRFDRVAKIASGAKDLPVIADFAGKEQVLVAGSTWEPDEELLIRLINENPSVKFIVAPHEMDEKRIIRLMESIEGGAVRYTRYEKNAAGSDCRLLVVDTIGILSSVYRYGNYAYIGGGFGVGIHNTLEAAAFGIPVAFGPNYGKFREAAELIEAGAARSVASYDELAAWFGELHAAEVYDAACSAAGGYVRSRCGATGAILREIFSPEA